MSDAKSDGATAVSDEVNGDADASSARENKTWQNPRSRWARRKHKKKTKELRQEKESGDEDAGSGGLDWEKFEFGER